MKNRITTVQPTSVRKGIAKPLVSGIPQRTIKFRCWDGKTMWLPDTLSNDGNKTKFVFYNEPKSIGWGLYDCFLENRIVTGDENAIVNTPGTLMQFIGLKDCKKKEIYTGDIVKWGHKKNSSECLHRYAIVQINPDLQLQIIYYKVAKTQELKPTDNYIFHWGRFAYGGKDLEVIGNVFQNPELLW